MSCSVFDLGGEELLSVSKKKTEPKAAQVPGTGGLRKKVRVFKDYAWTGLDGDYAKYAMWPPKAGSKVNATQYKNIVDDEDNLLEQGVLEVGTYLQNYVQSVFNTLADEGVVVKGGTLVVSGDGRHWNDRAIQIIIKMALANGVKRVWLGTNGLLSTPATSAVIRNREGGVAFGGFICTASHNPGGALEDFGIKYNSENGGGAPEKVTNKIAEHTVKIVEYVICEQVPTIDLTKPQRYRLGDRTIEVFDSVEDHLAALRQCFDFQKIKALLAREDFTFCFDSMCGSQGPYARRILEGELGGKAGSCINAEPKEDFGGPELPWKGHCDPNLEFAKELITKMGIDSEGRKIETGKPVPTFGAGADGDADRNMILGSHFFVSPSDSVAIIVANAALIPQFAGGLNGCARSMATGSALDIVAEKKGIPYFQVPTGWKFFGNLMDSEHPNFCPFVCGEESFGTGADHLREKDGMWAVLAWLQILAAKTAEAGKLVTVQDVVEAHWKEYGRNYYASYHYDGVPLNIAEAFMKELADKQGNLVGQEFEGMKIKINDHWYFKDPVDGHEKREGMRFIFENGSRIVFRLSGTAVDAATIRMYLDTYVGPDGDLGRNPFDVAKGLAAVADEVVSGLRTKIGRDIESPDRKDP